MKAAPDRTIPAVDDFDAAADPSDSGLAAAMPGKP
ncbi:hypothetical protein ABIB00_004086 [Bradyrhizobium sp. LB14.3]